MYKLIASILLITFMSWGYADTHNQEAMIQINQDLELIESFTVASKQLAGSYYTVGADPVGCDYKNIQNAIDAAEVSGTTDIRIATNKTYNENLVIDDLSLSLTGGYATCFAATQPFGGPGDNQVMVNGGNTASVLKITGNSQRHTVLLRNMRFIGGLGQAPNGDSAGGGILSYQADVGLSLTNVDVFSNDAEYGGGIAIIGGDTDMSMQDSRVFNNIAGYGGGIYCSGAASSIVMTEKSGVVANVANGPGPYNDINKQGRGGGVYLNGCYFGLHTGSADGGIIGIASNYAYGDGGGIYADGGSNILLNGHRVCSGNICKGDDKSPVNITGNVAGFTNEYGRGGGIYAKDSTAITINAGLVEGNSTGGKGGGIYVYKSSLKVGRLHKACWDQDHCNYIANNTLPTAYDTAGGAIYAADSDVDVSGAVFEHNLATLGAVLYSSGYVGNTDKIRVESSMITNNGDGSSQSIIHIENNISVDFIHTTLADNSLLQNVYGVAIFRSEDNPDLSLHSSIVVNSEFDVLSHNWLNYHVDISCIIANETESISASNNLINYSAGAAGGAYITQDDPIFLDPQNSNYYLAGNSPAIDYCHTPTHATVLYKDIRYKDRGYDDPNVADLSLFSFYDLGADESYINDIIFTDDFE